MRALAEHVPPEPRWFVPALMNHARCGPLWRPDGSALTPTRVPDWETVVLFGASMRARIATGSPHARNGSPMGGRPLRAVAAAFLADLTEGKDVRGAGKVESAVRWLEASGYQWLGWASIGLPPD
jgi:hypothetical protein